MGSHYSLLHILSNWEEIFANRPFNGPFSAFFNDFEMFNGSILTILHRLFFLFSMAIFQVNGTMVHGFAFPITTLANRTSCEMLQ